MRRAERPEMRSRPWSPVARWSCGSCGDRPPTVTAATSPSPIRTARAPRFRSPMSFWPRDSPGSPPTSGIEPALLGKERTAREGKLGLWGEAYYAVTGAESFEELVAERGRFAVAEGKVLSVRESGGTIYMNFGRRWSQALTVTILKRNERTFVAAGLDLRKLENRRLRVRGWVEERSGPRIEATYPEQIEITERN
jgi:hypothetical protein